MLCPYENSNFFKIFTLFSKKTTKVLGKVRFLKLNISYRISLTNSKISNSNLGFCRAPNFLLLRLTKILVRLVILKTFYTEAKPLYKARLWQSSFFNCEQSKSYVFQYQRFSYLVSVIFTLISREISRFFSGFNRISLIRFFKAC